MEGQKFGRLTVVRRAEGRRRKPSWTCACECGSQERAYDQYKLKSGHTRSCGCLQFIDMTGQTHGRLTVLHQVKGVGRTYNHARWLCRCSCGDTKEVRASHLRSGNVQSCGCLYADSEEKRLVALRAAITKHGQSTKTTKTGEYHSWIGMIQRATNPKDPAYHNYGGRGITVCPEWRASFIAFFEHIGPKPSPKHTLDRIDNERGYEPGNVRWATRREQLLNRRNAVYWEHNGQRLRALEWAEVTGLSINVLRSRIRKGWDVSRALTQPLKGESINGSVG